KPCGHLEPWSRTIAAVRRSAIDSTWLQPASGFQCRVALPVNRRPPAIRFARREFARVARFVQAFDQAIHPTEAQRLIECVQVRYRSHARMSLIEDEPHLGLGVVVLVEPFAPLVGSLSDKCLHGLRSVLSAQRAASAAAAHDSISRRRLQALLAGPRSNRAVVTLPRYVGFSLACPNDCRIAVFIRFLF